MADWSEWLRQDRVDLTFDEIRTVATKTELKNGRGDAAPKVTDEQLQERFAQFGGVARSVLRQDYSVSQQEFDNDVVKITGERAVEVLKPFSRSQDAASLFVHIHSIPIPAVQ